MEIDRYNNHNEVAERWIPLQSIQSKVFKILLKLVRRKKFWYKTGDALRKGIAKRRKKDYTPPTSLVESMQITLHEENGFSYYMINETVATDSTHILYVHGGGYIHRITKYHWHFLGRLAKELQCTITVPIYPLAPEYTYKDTFAFVVPLYENILTKSRAENTVIMGDSAGGGLALSLIQLLKKKDVPLPMQTILISPWLDLTLENNLIDKIDPVDPFLAKIGAIEAGQMYAGGTDRHHYLLSPLYGDLTGLGRVAIFMGTHDILVADARKLVQKMETEGSPIMYYEYLNMVHVFPLFTFPEAKKAFKQIVGLIRQG